MSATPDRSKAPATHIPSDIKLPAMRELTLDNGMKVSALDHPDTEISRLTVITEGGMAEAGNPAIALLDSQLRQEGTTTTDGLTLADHFDFNGAWTACSSGNHHRSFTVYHLESKRQMILPQVIDILTDPSFPADRLAKWRERMIAQTAIEQQTVGYQASALSREITIGAGHPLAQNPDPDRIAAIDRDTLLDFHRRNLHPRHIRLFIAGRLTPSLEHQLNRSFGSITPPQGMEEPSSCIVPFNIGSGKRGFRTVDGALQSAVCVTLRGIDRNHPDYLPLRMTVNALGGYFGSRLSANIRERLGLTYGIHASLLGYAEGGMISIATECDNAYRDRVVDEIASEMTRLATAPPDADEMERIRMTELSSLLDIMETPFTVSDFYQSMHINGISPDYFDQRLMTASTMSPEIIADMASKYLRPDLMNVAIAGKNSN